MDDIETWTADECAAAWGVKTLTFMGYVSRDQAPAPLAERDRHGRRLWSADEVRRFPRPGPGRSRAGAGADAEALLAQLGPLVAELTALAQELRHLVADAAPPAPANTRPAPFLTGLAAVGRSAWGSGPIGTPP